MSAASTAEISLTVTEADTASAFRSGDVPVLATPRLVALAEEAAVAAVGELPAGQTSVGVHIEFEHLLASRVGATVTARAKLTSARHRRLDFELEVTEQDRIVARGSHTRVIVDRARFG